MLRRVEGTTRRGIRPKHRTIGNDSICGVDVDHWRGPVSLASETEAEKLPTWEVLVKLSIDEPQDDFSTRDS